MIANVRSEEDDLPTVLCGQVGPRGDGYVISDLMTTHEAEDYHSAQIEVYSNTEADLVCASTICYAEEAAGVVRAAQRFDMPVAISFTVETDGRLPTGMPVREAIEQVDAESGESALYFLINCAHPDHFTSILAMNHGCNVYEVWWQTPPVAVMPSWRLQRSLTMVIHKSWVYRLVDCVKDSHTSIVSEAVVVQIYDI